MILLKVMAMLLVVLAAVTTIATSSPPPNVRQGLPVVGEIWGPVITHAGVMKTVKGANQLLHTYGYPRLGKRDMLADYILPSEIFSTRSEMDEHIKNKVEDTYVILQSDPEALEDKYLEVLTMKSVPFDKVKIICHSYKTNPAFCHEVGGATSNHPTKIIYSMVRETTSGKAFPCLFFSHKGCSEKDNESSCYWVTHINEIVMIEKDLI